MMKRSLWIAAVLALALLAGCGGAPAQPGPDSGAAAPVSPVEDSAEPGRPAAPPATQPEAGDVPSEPPAPAPEAAPAPEPAPAPETTPDPDPTPEPPPAPDPEPAAAPAPAPAPEPEGESVRAGDTYTISVTLEGGSGRASVESPAKLHFDETGKCWATIVWSSPNFDYMKVDGQRYDPISTEGNSTFEILVSAFDTPLPIIADTVAMSEPHEVEYTLTFDYASMEDA
jgi:hypothetical protein